MHFISSKHEIKYSEEKQFYNASISHKENSLIFKIEPGCVGHSQLAV